MIEQPISYFVFHIFLVRYSQRIYQKLKAYHGTKCWLT